MCFTFDPFDHAHARLVFATFGRPFSPPSAHAGERSLQQQIWMLVAHRLEVKRMRRALGAHVRAFAFLTGRFVARRKFFGVDQSRLALYKSASLSPLRRVATGQGIDGTMWEAP
jgi:hypothetical protein